MLSRSEEGEYIDVFNRRATLTELMDRRPNAEVILARALRARFRNNLLGAGRRAPRRPAGKALETLPWAYPTATSNLPSML